MSSGAPKRNQRPQRYAAQNSRFSDMKVDYQYEDYQPFASGPAGNATRVDLTKLKVQALRKYSKVYEVPGVHAQSTKEDLNGAVTKHFNAMTVTEENVLQNLLRLRGRY